MPINAKQLRDFVVKPFLTDSGLYSLEAEQLLLGTAAVESDMGTYIHQVSGPALGIFQMEPFTYQDIWVNYLNARIDLHKRILYTCHYVTRPDESALVHNLGYATLMARVKYLRSPKALPNPNDVYGMSVIWKDVYNTVGGKGTIQKFQDAYLRHVAPLYK